MIAIAITKQKWFDLSVGPNWLWIAIGAALLVSGLLLPLTTYHTYLLYGSAIPFLLISAVTTMRRPEWGLTGLIVLSFFFPFSITGYDTPLFAAFLVVAWLGRMILTGGKIALQRSRVMAPLLLFSVFSIFSFGIGQFQLFPTDPAPMTAQVTGLAIFLLSTALFLAAGHQIHSLKQLDRLMWVFLVLAILRVAGMILPGPFQLLNSFGPLTVALWLWLIVFAMGQALFNHELAFKWRVVLGFVGLAALGFRITVLFSQASGWLPTFAALIVLIALARPALILIGAALVGSAALIHLDKILEVILVHEAYSLMTRWEALLIMLDITKASPLLGLGPANYYFYTSFFPILGWYVPFNSHNNFIDILAQLGIVGLLLFLWLLWELVRLAWRLSFQAPSGFARAYARAALAGVVGMAVAAMLGDWILPFVYNIGLSGFRTSLLNWMFLGGLLVIERHRFQSVATSQERSSV